MHAWTLFGLVIAALCATSVIAQGLFPLFQAFQPAPTASLPHKRPVGRSPNEKLKACCANLPQADNECKARFCDFNALSSNTVLFFLSMCAPRGPTVGQMWDCSSTRADHTSCCRTKGVQPGCQIYCQTTNGVPTDYFKYLACLRDFDKIRDCFSYYLIDNKNLHGEL